MRTPPAAAFATRAAGAPLVRERWRAALDALVARTVAMDRVSADPVRFPRRYADARDAEVAGLLAAALAYGRVAGFAPRIEGVLDALGARPAEAVRRLSPARAVELLDGFVYRFTTAADFAVLLCGAGRLLERHGSLERAFLAGDAAGPLPLRESMRTFCRGLIAAADADLPALRRRLGPTRGLAHLLPTGPGANKRMCLYLRWMVRGPDGVDLGLWRGVAAARLVVPLDTHLARVARRMGLTRRSDLSWRTAEDVTASLRAVAPEDPVRYDFALCHHGMSGACPARLRREACGACPAREVCVTGRRLLGVRRRES